MITSSDFGNAYVHGFPRTVRFLVARGAIRDHASEAAQAAWARAWEYLPQLRDDRLLLTWINSIAINVYRRSRQKESHFAPLLDVFAPGTPDSNLASIDLGRALRVCRAKERALLMQYMQGFTAEDLARDWGVSYTAIRLRLMRARRAVQRNLKMGPGRVASNGTLATGRTKFT
jgi:DNA-directed RNA polymerase specialized sigma24 family protein